MKLVKFTPPGSAALWGILEEERIIVTNGPGGERTGNNYALDKVVLKAPANPTKIVCVGQNYVDHIKEMENDAENLPKEPGLFLKAPNALADPGESIPYPPFTKEFHYEGELAAVVGCVLKNVSEDEVLRCVLGYTIGIDLTARECQRNDLQWIRAKSADKFCPLGPWIETDLDPRDVGIRTVVSGRVAQDSRTSLMIFPVARILSYISSFMTLYPGDVVLTGTPSGVGPLQRGDEIAVTVEGVGTLVTRIS
jgi:2-keto-4-pentenoate hydratase/2-oxohepta-3-ene-1,7-dioic acid hydratase in catechol pathway